MSAGRLTTAIVLLFITLGGLNLNCTLDGKSGKAEDKGLTGDVGNTCWGLCPEIDWCFDSNLPTCVSAYCVGRSSATYCTQLCESDAECPDDYRCTWNCNQDLSDQPYCVKKADYEYLISLNKCS